MSCTLALVAVYSVDATDDSPAPGDAHSVVANVIVPELARSTVLRRTWPSASVRISCDLPSFTTIVIFPKVTSFLPGGASLVCNVERVRT
jgi:hypothetical protein